MKNTNQNKTYSTFLEQLSETESPQYLVAAPIIVEALAKEFTIDLNDAYEINRKQAQYVIDYYDDLLPDKFKRPEVGPLPMKDAIKEISKFKQFIFDVYPEHKKYVTPYSLEYFKLAYILSTLQSEYWKHYNHKDKTDEEILGVSMFVVRFVLSQLQIILDALSTKGTFKKGLQIISQLTESEAFSKDKVNDYIRVIRDLTLYFESKNEKKYLRKRKKYERSKFIPLYKNQ
jgi:hypothetical protein